MVQPETQTVGGRDPDRAWGGRDVSQPGKPVDLGVRNRDLLVLHGFSTSTGRQALRHRYLKCENFELPRSLIALTQSR